LNITINYWFFFC